MGTTLARRRCPFNGTTRAGDWIGCGHHPRRPDPVVVDPSYVVIVRDRLTELYPKIPETLLGARHLIEWCLVDLALALGEVPTHEQSNPDESETEDG